MSHPSAIPCTSSTGVSNASVARRFGDLNPKTFEACGGEESVFRIARSFYTKVFANDVLAPLFAVKDDSHPTRLAWFLMSFMEVSDRYFEEGGSLGKLHHEHHKAMYRKERLEGPKGCGRPGTGFTCTQRDTWQQLFHDACVDCGLTGGILRDMDNYVSHVMRFYGPFTADRQS